MNGNRIPLMSFSHRDESKCVISNISYDVLDINFRTCLLLVEIICARVKYLKDSREVGRALHCHVLCSKSLFAPSLHTCTFHTLAFSVIS